MQIPSMRGNDFVVSLLFRDVKSVPREVPVRCFELLTVEATKNPAKSNPYANQD